VLAEAVPARCEASPSVALPLPPILKALRTFFGVTFTCVSGWEDGGTDSLAGRTSGSGSFEACGNGGGDSVPILDFPPIRKFFGLAFVAGGVGALGEGEGEGSGVGDFLCGSLRGVRP
jgi:hypothetical protein